MSDVNKREKQYGLTCTEHNRDVSLSLGSKAVNWMAADQLRLRAVMRSKESALRVMTPLEVAARQ